MHGHGLLFLYMAQRARRKRLASPDAPARAAADTRGRLGLRTFHTVGSTAALKEAEPLVEGTPAWTTR